MSRRSTPAPNAVVRPVVEYLPDPRGAGMFAALNARINDGVHGARAIVAGPSYSGWVRTTQQFAGAQASLGRARAVAPTSATLNDQKTAESAVAGSIFRERMLRGLG